MKLVKIETVAKGEFVKLVRAGKATGKTYIKREYSREDKKWQLDDCEDVWGNGRQIKSGTLVYVGFDY